MSFWATSTGENAAENASASYDAGGGFEVIPDKSWVVAEIDSIGWEKDDNFNNFISARWNVLKPESLAGRKWFQKLWVEDLDPKAKSEADGMKKRDKALNMLAAIDANCGGRLARAGRRPDDDSLALSLTGKDMGVLVRVWEFNGNEGNWTAAVAPTKETTVKVGETKKPAGGSSVGRTGSFGDDLGDDVPF